MIKNGCDLKFVTEWRLPEGDDLRPLVAMPNIPKPLHLINPRNLLGKQTWDRMRKFAYSQADDTCEICGNKPENLRNRHGHEVYDIDYVNGTVTFKKVCCLCSLCHLGGIHTGRAITLYKQGNPLYPKEFLLEGAEHAFEIINAYNQDHPDADLRAYSTYLEYLKQPELEKPMRDLIEKYNIKFYEENTKVMAEWPKWKLIIGSREYPTPYANEEEWQAAMAEHSKFDSARAIAENPFKGDGFSAVDDILKSVDKDANAS